MKEASRQEVRMANDGEPADILITLHAIKGAPALFDFKKRTPNGRVVILLTGTDIYQGLPEGSQIGGGRLAGGGSDRRAARGRDSKASRAGAS